MQQSKTNPNATKERPAAVRETAKVTVPPPCPVSPLPAVEEEVPSIEAFLEEAKNEPKRKLLSDHVETIQVLRNQKRFTFRAIADWLTARGIETDHSAVYRAYLAAIPEEQRDPRQDWSDVDAPE